VLQILGLIENMSFFKCPKCGDRCDVFGHGGAQTTAQEMDMEFLGEVLNNWNLYFSPYVVNFLN
jgi:Mrp family chromosome partitioning ATPase